MATFNFAFLALLLICCVANPCNGSTHKRSTDELNMRFLSHLSSEKLIGEPGSMHQLAFELTNNGNNAVFQLRQTGSDGFEGQIVPSQSVSVPSRTVKTISVVNLVVPSVPSGQYITFTLSAQKDLSVGGQMSEVSSTVNFLVGNPQDLIDDRKPEVTIQYGGSCQVPRNDTKCANFQWQVEYHVRDLDSGLLSVEVTSMGRDSILSPVIYSMPNFAIGSRDTVDVSVDISCCNSGVTVRAIDVHGNEENIDSLRDANSASSVSGLRFGILVAVAAILKKIC